MSKKSSVFIGPGNTAGNAKHFAQTLRGIGIKATSFSYTKHPFGYDTDVSIKQINSDKIPEWLKKLKFGFIIYNINGLLRLFYFIYTLFSFNTFMFISTGTILRNFKDIQILKFFKKNNFHFCWMSGAGSIIPNQI